MRALPHRIAALVVTLCVAWGASGCASPARALRVLHTTDVHGYYGERPGGVGGARRLASRVERERASVAVLLVDSGDMWSGTLLSDRTEGALGVALYNTLGYDAVALGNHEFDYGPVGPSREGGADPLGALKARLAEVRFPVLAANLIDRATGERPAWPNLHAGVIVERGGFRVGLVGVITPTTPSITFPHVGELLIFEDPVAAAVREATRLREQEGADLVYLLAHLGGRCAELGDERDLSSCEEASELFRLARALPPGVIDAIFGGHTHKQVRHRIDGLALLQGGSYGELVSQLDVRQPQGVPSRTRMSRPQPLTGEPRGRLARTVERLLRPAVLETVALRSEELGARLVRPLVRDRWQGSPLGAFLCDALLAARPDREICLLNSGGLRRDLGEGELTYGELYDVMPFGNEVAELDLTGAELREVLRLGTTGAHGVLQVGGLELAYDRSRDVCPTIDRDGDGDVDRDDRDRLAWVQTADRAELDPTRTYRIVTNSFLARGGDGLRSVLQRVPAERIRVKTDALPVRDEIAAWLRQRRPIVNSPDLPVLTTPRVRALGEAPSAECPGLAPSGH